MSKKSNPQTTAANTESASRKYTQFPLAKINFILMAIAAVMIIIGFALTAGGGTDDPSVFNPEVFSVRRIVVGPNIAFFGFLFMGLGIMWPSKSRKKSNSDK